MEVVGETKVAHALVRVAVANDETVVVVLYRPLDEALVGRQVHDVVLVDPRRTEEQWHVVDLLGLGLVLELSAWRGQPPLLLTSSNMFFAPRSKLAPPVSAASRSAAGFPYRVLVGASASRMNFVAKRALASSIPSSSAASRSSSKYWQPSRYC